MPMTALPSSRPDPWRFIWRTVTGNIPLAVCLLLLALYLLLLAWIPQFSPGSAAADRWLVQTRFGPWTTTMYQLGVFSLAGSPILPLLLSVLAFLLLVRGIEEGTALRSHLRSGNGQKGKGTPLVSFFPLLACLGTLILLMGLLIGRQWGWREEGLIALENGRVPGHHEVPRLYVIRFGPRLVVRATDTAGRPLNLQQTVLEAARPELTLYLSPSAPETSFAVPERNLIVRLWVRGTFSAGSPIQVEVFRAPGGERIHEAEIDQDLFRLTVEETNLEIAREPYPLLAAAYDPGLWLKRVGVILSTLSLAGVLWPWQRKERVWSGFLVLLTLTAGGLSAWSLEARGTLGEIFPLQTEISAFWMICLAVWLIRHTASNRE